MVVATVIVNDKGENILMFKKEDVKSWPKDTFIPSIVGYEYDPITFKGCGEHLVKCNLIDSVAGLGLSMLNSVFLVSGIFLIYVYAVKR